MVVFNQLFGLVFFVITRPATAVTGPGNGPEGAVVQ